MKKESGEYKELSEEKKGLDDLSASIGIEQSKNDNINKIEISSESSILRNSIRLLTYNFFVALPQPILIKEILKMQDLMIL